VYLRGMPIHTATGEASPVISHRKSPQLVKRTRNDSNVSYDRMETNEDYIPQDCIPVCLLHMLTPEVTNA